MAKAQNINQVGQVRRKNRPNDFLGRFFYELVRYIIDIVDAFIGACDDVLIVYLGSTIDYFLRGAEAVFEVFTRAIWTVADSINSFARGHKKEKDISIISPTIDRKVINERASFSAPEVVYAVTDSDIEEVEIDEDHLELYVSEEIDVVDPRNEVDLVTLNEQVAIKKAASSSFAKSFWQGLKKAYLLVAELFGFVYDFLRMAFDLVFNALALVVGLIGIPLSQYLNSEPRVTTRSSYQEVNLASPADASQFSFWRSLRTVHNVFIDLLSLLPQSLVLLFDILFAIISVPVGFILRPVVDLIENARARFRQFWLKRRENKGLTKNLLQDDEAFSESWDEEVYAAQTVKSVGQTLQGMRRELEISYRDSIEPAFMVSDNVRVEPAYRAVLISGYQFVASFLSVYYDLFTRFIDIVFNGLGALISPILGPVAEYLNQPRKRGLVGQSQAVGHEDDSVLWQEAGFVKTMPAAHYSLRWLSIAATVICLLLLTLFLEWGTGTSGVIRPLAHFLGFAMLLAGLLKLVNWDHYLRAYYKMSHFAASYKVYRYTLPFFQLGLGILFITQQYLEVALVLTFLFVLSFVIGVAMQRQKVDGGFIRAPYFSYLSWLDLMRGENLVMTIVAAAILYFQYFA